MMSFMPTGDPHNAYRPTQPNVRSSRQPVFRDPAMAAVVSRAQRAAKSDASVLISGASGTGKEVLARYIHMQSARAERPFVAVNCAAIPETLLESELFGHEKGAFSGAIGRRIGKFEAANTGSLLLDEITEIELGLQAKLLRVIQEREIDRIGGSQPVRVNVRIMATTNRDIQREVHDGVFREDLFYRLNVLAIVIPELKDRPDDILPLAESFLERYTAATGVKILSPEAADLLRAYHWPGNVRELENVVHRASVMSDERVIDPSALEISLENPHPPHLAARLGSPARLKTLERDAIMSTLEHNGGNRTKTAAALGISIRTLRNKLNRYELGVA